MTDIEKAEMILAKAKKLFLYDSETGVFSRKPQIPIRRVRKKVGWLDKDGYIALRVYGTECRAHRLAWLLSYGYMPKFIDHINGIRDDNRLCNLRECKSRAENNQNYALPKNNKTGFIGVAIHGKRFTARIQSGGVQIYLGCFKTKEQAAIAYAQAKKKYHTFHSEVVTRPVKYKHGGGLHDATSNLQEPPPTDWTPGAKRIIE